MKRVFALVASTLTLFACADTTPMPVAPVAPPAPVAIAAPTPPLAADPEPVTEGNVTVAWAHGMEILVKRTPGAEFVAAELVIRGGVRNWTPDNAGIEQLAIQVATSGGTQTLPKRELATKLASLGASIGGDAQNDYSSIAAKAPLASWDDLFPIFADTFLAPALPPNEFDVVKQRELSGLRHEMEDGDGRLWLLARRTLFAGHPYANRAIGTLETVESIKSTDLAPHLAKLRDANRLVLVVVGDVDAAHVIDQVRRTFASVPRGSYVESAMPQLHFDAARLTGDPFKIPTNYIQAAFAGPSWSDPDFETMRLAMSLLRDRMFDEVRTKRNLSYAPAADFRSDLAAPFGLLSVTAVDPTTTMKVMFEQAHRLQTELIPPKELDGTKAVYLSAITQTHEAVNWQAYVLGEAIVQGGDWHRANTFIDKIRAVTPEDIRRAAAKWLINPQTAIVGDPTKLDPKVVGAP